MRWSADVENIMPSNEEEWGEWRTVFEGMLQVLTADVVLGIDGLRYELALGPAGDEIANARYPLPTGIVYSIHPPLVVPAGERLAIRCADDRGVPGGPFAVEAIVEGHFG